jgi:hypothetical protein
VAGVTRAPAASTKAPNLGGFGGTLLNDLSPRQTNTGEKRKTRKETETKERIRLDWRVLVVIGVIR